MGRISIALSVLIMTGFCLFATPAAHSAEIYYSGLNQFLYMDGKESFFDWGALPEFGTADSTRTVLENRLTLDISIDNLTLGGRLDILEPGYHTESRAYFGSSYTQEVRYSELRKRHAEFSDAGFRCRIGDFSALFGRGLALNLFEDPGMQIDRELDGTLLGFEGEKGGVTLFSGKAKFHNYMEVPFDDGADETFTGSDVVRGVGVAFRPGSLPAIGGGYIRVDDALAVAPGGGFDMGKRNEKGYVHCNVDFGIGSAYAEGARSWTFGGGDPPLEGKGLYSGLNLYLDEVCFNLEYKYYKFNETYWNPALGETVPYFDPPPVRRQQDLLTLSRHYRETDRNDETGWMATWSYSPNYLSTYSFGGGVSSEIAPDEIVPFRRRDLDPETELFFEADIELESGYMFKIILDYLEQLESGTRYSYLTTGLTAKVFSDNGYTLGYSVELQQVDDERLAGMLDDDSPEDAHRFWDGVLTLSFEASPWFACHVSAEITNELKVRKKFAKGIYIPQPGEALQNSYASAGADFQISDRHILSLMYGSLRGGKLCHGGVCREVPGFEGFRMELITSF